MHGGAGGRFTPAEGDGGAGGRREPGHETGVEELGRPDRADRAAGGVAQFHPYREGLDRRAGWTGVAAGAVRPRRGRRGRGEQGGAADGVGDPDRGGEPAGDDLAGGSGPAGRFAGHRDGIGRRVQLLAEGADRGSYRGGGEFEPLPRPVIIDHGHGSAGEERTEQHRTEHDGEEGGGQPSTQRHFFPRKFRIRCCDADTARHRKLELPQECYVPDFSDEAEVTDESHGEKVAFRAVLLARRRALPGPDRAAAARRIQAELTELVRRTSPRRVTGYVPVGSEPGGPDLPDRLLAALDPTGELLLPVLRPDLDLDWAAHPGSGRPGALVAAGRGLREPSGDRLGPGAIGTAELVVVPALAVDRRGIRLGRGGGSYDRALARVAPGALTVALLHDGELVDRVPAAAARSPGTAVITPAGGFQPLAAG